MAQNELPTKEKKVDLRQKKYDSYIVINKVKRGALTSGCSIAFLLILGILFDAITREISWTVVVVPISLIGSLLVFIPPSESWEYSPWQSKPQRYERHMKDQNTF